MSERKLFATEMFIRELAFKIFAVALKIVGSDHLSTIFEDSNLTDEVCRCFIECTRTTFHDIRCGAHECKGCPAENLYLYTLPADKDQDARMTEMLTRSANHLSRIPQQLLTGDEILQRVAAHFGIQNAQMSAQ